MNNFSIELCILHDGISRILNKMFYGIELQTFLERIKYVADSNLTPVQIFKTIGISRVEAFKILHGIRKIDFMSNTEISNYVDFDNWKHINEMPSLKDKYKNECYSSMTDSLYFCKWFKWTQGSSKFSHPSYNAIVKSYNNLEIATFLSYVGIDYTKSPQENLMANDSIIKIIQQDIIDRESVKGTEFYINNKLLHHCFTNAFILKNEYMLSYIGKKMKHCGGKESQIEKALTGNFLYVQFKDKVEYSVEFKIEHERRRVRIFEVALKCNKPITNDFDRSYCESFRLFLQQRLFGSSTY